MLEIKLEMIVVDLLLLEIKLEVMVVDLLVVILKMMVVDFTGVGDKVGLTAV